MWIRRIPEGRTLLASAPAPGCVRISSSAMRRSSTNTVGVEARFSCHYARASRSSRAAYSDTESVVASLARELVEQLIAIHELPALDALDAAGELGVLGGRELELFIIFVCQDRYGRALPQALAFDLDPAGDNLAGDQLHRSPRQ
jgi:hypothetical protein